MAAQLYYSPFIPAFSPNGLPVPAARLYFFYSGTDNLAPVYTNSSLAVRARNPVVADLAARFDPVYLDDSITYRVRLTDALGIQLGDDIDPYVPGQALKGPQGDPGKPDNTYSTLLLFKNSNTALGVATLQTTSARYYWTTGDFTNQDDDDVVIKSNLVPITSGAWVRDGALLPNIIADGRDNTAFLRVYHLRGYKIPKKANPYVISSTIELSKPQLVEQGTRFTWAGPDKNGAVPIGVFKMLDNSGLISDGGRDNRIYVECPIDQHMVYATLGVNSMNIDIIGVFGRHCGHFANGFTGRTWNDVVTPKMKAAGDTRPLSTGGNIRIYGGGCVFDSNGGVNWSGCSVEYSFGIQVEDCSWIRGGHGFVWWGGDSNPNSNGALANERKCGNIRISRCHAEGTAVAGIWGSMGTDIRVENCTMKDIGDVACDSEGNFNLTYEGNDVINANNGCFTTFHFNKNVKFIGNSGIQLQKDKPVFRVYNETNSYDNRDITFFGNNCECTDTTGPSTVDSSFGPCNFLNITDNVLTNVIINVYSMPNSVAFSVVENNKIFLPVLSAAFVLAIRVEGNINDTIIRDNVIRSIITQPAQSRPVLVRASSPAATAIIQIKRNTWSLPVVGGVEGKSYMAWAGANSGIGATFVIEDNQGGGAIETTSTGAASTATFIDGGNNRNRAGALMPLESV